MSDDEVSDDEVLATENDENQDMVPELKTAGSFDLEDSLDEFDEEEEEEEEDDADLGRQGSIDMTETLTTQNQNNISTTFTENTDDKSKFQQSCFDTMRALRVATSKSINQESAKKALDLVYENCKARFHAKERLGSSGASEYLHFLFKRWRSDTELLIRACEVISEYVLNETENKILMGVQGIGREIVFALDEHRRHWPAINALTTLVIDLCNSKLPGMLQQNIMRVAKRELETKVDVLTASRDSRDASIFEQTRISLALVDGDVLDIAIASSEEKASRSDSRDAFEGLGDTHAVGTLCVLQEDQWLLDNREQFGRMGICHILTHIVSLLCDYQNAHTQQPAVHQMLMGSGRRQTLGGPASSSTGTPRHHLLRSSLGGNAEVTAAIAASASHPILPSMTSSFAQSSGSHRATPVAAASTDDNSQHSFLPIIVPPAASASAAVALNSDSTNDTDAAAAAAMSSSASTPAGSQHGTRPSSGVSSGAELLAAPSLSHLPAEMAESLRLQLPPIVTTSSASNLSNPPSKGTTPKAASAMNSARYDPPLAHVAIVNSARSAHNSRPASASSTTSNAGSHVGLRNPSHPTAGQQAAHHILNHANTASGHAHSVNSARGHSHSHSGHGHSSRASHVHATPHQTLQQMLYTNHDWPIDGLIATLMRAVAVLSDFECNAKRFGEEGLCLYITHLLVDKSATSASSLQSARSSVVVNHNGTLSTPRGQAVGPRTEAHFLKTNALLWAMILLCADSSIGNKQRFGQAGATFLLIDRLHEVMRNVDVYRKDTDSRRYVEYLSWALLNLVMDCPLNCELVKQITYADVVLDHLLTMEVEVLVPAGQDSSRPGTHKHPSLKPTTKAQAKEILRASFAAQQQQQQGALASAISTAATAGGGRKTFIAGMTTAHASTAHHHQGPMVAQKELAMTAGTRQKLGKVKEIVYCVM